MTRNEIFSTHSDYTGVATKPSVWLATFNKDKYVNLVSTRHGSTAENISFTPADARQLRDQLIEMYPLTDAAKPSPVKSDETIPGPQNVKQHYIIAAVDAEGQPLPSEKPHVHSTYEDAVTESSRLAKAYPQSTFVIYAATETTRMGVVRDKPIRTPDLFDTYRSLLKTGRISG